MSSSYSQATNRHGNAHLSPAHNRTLPAKENNNNNKRESREKKVANKSTAVVSATKEKLSEEIIESPNPTRSSLDSEPNLSNKRTSSAPGSANNEMSDNTELRLNEVLPPHNSHDDTKETLKQVLADLQEIKSTTCKIPIIEEATTTFSKDLQSVIKRTSSLESALQTSTARVRELDEEVSTLKEVVRKQELSISALQKLQRESSESIDKKIQDLDGKIMVQKEQAESLLSSSDYSKQELLQVIDSKIDDKIASQTESDAQEAHYYHLREQAFQNRFNLVLSGLPEDKQKSSLTLVNDFLRSSLNITQVDILSASRLGQTPDEETSYARPILIKFAHLPHRNLVWRKRRNLTGDNDGQKTRIHADLPKELREGVQLLYKVSKAAAKQPQFHSAKVVNYQLELDGKSYLPSQLESLPHAIRPSTLATPRSDNALVFFSCSSVLSNHFPSDFIIEEQKYTSMEHYLAVRKARISERKPMIQKAIQSKDPKQAKYILNALKGDHEDVWNESIIDITLEGLGAKFNQNPVLNKFLCATNNLHLGEASTNPRWGIGMTLDDPDVLDTTKWRAEGNLLGNLLMRVREELRQ